MPDWRRWEWPGSGQSVKSPDLNLYHQDGRHAGPAGAYLAACVFYVVLFKASPAGLPSRFNIKGKPRVDLDEKNAFFLQQIAYRTVKGIKPLPMIKAILFDFGQTLVDSADGFRRAEKKAKERIYASLFPDPYPDTDPDADSWSAFLKEYRRLRNEFHQRSEFSRPSIWRAVYQHFKTESNPNQLEKWETDYWAQVKSQTRPFPETMDVLEKLTNRYHLGLVTNTQGQKKNEGRHRIALFPELEEFFAAIIVAGEAGIPPKPDPKPFELCLKNLGVTPGQAVFIGDDWRIDIGGATNAGLQPVWIKHRTVNRRWPEITTAIPVISSLNELLGMFA